jgi:plastocyanin
VKRMHWIGVPAVLTALVLVLGACGSDDSSDSGSSGSSGGAQTEESGGGGSGGSGGAGETVKLSASEFKFTPANAKVAKAGKVKFQLTNDGQAPHALEIEGPGDEVETKTIQGGESASVTADLSKAGSYTFYCPVGNHRQMGMEGKVTVGGGSASSGGASDDKGGGGY